MLRYARPRLILRGVSRVSRRAASSGSGDTLKQHAIRRGDAPQETQTLPERPMLFMASFWLRWTLIPGALVYMVFWADWGEGDHVFRPPRRWLDQQKAAFFNLSPEERDLVQSQVQMQQSTPAVADPPKKSTA
ncbi:hypothetical protein OE88DRAFT_1657745 [Heliocybe sulcata]|uniref:Uncharacterized protein n=1 Tax=Heliocybe sulcata TaxID=5364 RepID=A0A5C3N5L2_9AGAM|nr:hypothetical protein OE88DRAFT_1657745 [Heliocybe sulcata]